MSNYKEYYDKVRVVGYPLNALFTFGYLLVSKPQQLFFNVAALGISEAIGLCRGI